jgi:Family of unknown function (DUF5320)
MPKGDRTGPMGSGSMRGRAAGFCAGFDLPGYANAGVPRGFGMGMHRGWCSLPGGGRGRRRGSFFSGGAGPGYFGGYPVPPQPLNPEWGKEALENRSLALKSELEAIGKRLTEMAAQEKKQ